MIPKLLHFIWTGRPMPLWVADNIQRWRELNPGYVVTIHNEKCLDQEWADLYSRCEDVCTRSDLLRLSVLRQHGGWYFDTDFVPLRPLDDIYADYDLSCGCFLTKQWEPGPKRIANGVMGMATDAEAWKHIHRYIAAARLAPIERTTFGPLMTTHVVQRCPETVISQIDEFYLWRFDPRPPDPKTPTAPLRKYETLLAGGFDEASIEATCGMKRPYAVHLWCGGTYEWQPSIHAPTELPKPVKSEPTTEFCDKCHGRGCVDCKMSGFMLVQQRQMPPKDKAEEWFDAYGWKVSCWESGKIVLLPK